MMCVFTGERGSGFGEHLGPKHGEHGEGSRLPAGRGARRFVGKLQIHRLLAVCRRTEIPGTQSDPGR